MKKNLSHKPEVEGSSPSLDTTSKLKKSLKIELFSILFNITNI